MWLFQNINIQIQTSENELQSKFYVKNINTEIQNCSFFFNGSSSLFRALASYSLP
jgi:hypothetical protein